MKKIAKILGVLLLLVVLCVVGLIAAVEFVRHRSQKEVVSIVSQLSPGTSYSAAVQRLGKPMQVFTDGDEIVWWVEKIGSRVDVSIATNSVLHVFSHRGPPYRFILIYTDRESQRIVHADWWHM